MTTTSMIPVLRTDGGGAAAKTGWRGWVALAVLMLPVLLVSIDNTVLTFALPAIALDLQPTAIQQLWIIDVYPLVLAGLLVTMGTLGDRFGRRRMLLIGATGFGILSVVAAFAPTAALLIAARAAMGFFGAMLMPSTLSLVRTVFPDREQRRLAVAIWAAGFSAGSALGPVVGGVLLAHFGWGSVFLLAVPVLVPLLILGPFLLPSGRDASAGRIDPISIVLAMGTMVAVVYGIKKLAMSGLDTASTLYLVGGLVLGAIFVWRQLRRDDPMLDVTLFRRGAFSGALIVNLLSVIALVGFLFMVAQHLQLVVGLSALEAGLALVPGLAATILSGLLVVPIAQRVSPRIVVPVALVLSASAYLLIATGLGSLAVVVGAFVLLGTGIGAAQTIAGELILSSADPRKAGAASAVSETAYELGAVLGTAVLGGILSAQYATRLTVPAGLSGAATAEAQETLAGALSVAAGELEPLASSLREAALQAFEQGAAITSLIGACLVLAGAVVAATTLKGTHGASR